MSATAVTPAILSHHTTPHHTTPHQATPALCPDAPIQASIVIPTRARPDYLAVALASIAPQAQAAGAEVLVVDDAGSSPTVRALAERHDARYEPHAAPLGLNVARNTGVRCSSGELVVFVDDDVEVRSGWLQALLHAASNYPEAEVFTGPIRARLEGPAPHSCGREQPPITTLDLGTHDTRDIRFAWGANMAIRRRALHRVGPFDTSFEHGGDEQDWQERLLAQAHSDGRDARPIVYVASAAVDHRRAGEDARLRSLAQTAHARGRAGRRLDTLRGQAPSLPRETLTLLGCLGHVVRYRCPAGLTMVAHSIGRLEEGLRERRG
jgi:GT2 family glycosyltransferase